MVSDQDYKAPEEAEKPIDRKKYVVIKNHVREFPSEKNLQDLEINDEQCSAYVSKKNCKSSRRQCSLSSDQVNNISLRYIAKTDLDELKTVYNQCKAILSKLESKYGHLLNLSNDTTRKRKRDDEEKEHDCKMNMKIIYDDEGNQIVQNPTCNVHVCAKKLLKHSQPHEMFDQRVSIIEEMNCDALPNTIPELGEMLKNLNISATLRRKIIRKIKSTQFNNLNSLRFYKTCLIEAAKSNADEVFNFKGSNLSSLHGYITS